MSEVSLNPRPVPVGATGRSAIGYWGLVAFLASEACLFAYLIFSYAYIAMQLKPSAAPAARLSFTYSLPMTIVVIASSVTLYWAERSIKRGQVNALIIALLIVLVLSVSFVILEGIEWKSLHFSLTSSALGSAYYVMTGMHLTHFIVGIIATVLILIWARLDYFDSVRNVPTLILFDYWHFVHAVWGVIFIAAYIIPYIG